MIRTYENLNSEASDHRATKQKVHYYPLALFTESRTEERPLLMALPTTTIGNESKLEKRPGLALNKYSPDPTPAAV